MFIKRTNETKLAKPTSRLTIFTRFRMVVVVTVALELGQKPFNVLQLDEMTIRVQTNQNKWKQKAECVERVINFHS